MKKAVAIMGMAGLLATVAPSPISAHEVVLRTGLNGDREVPGPGDPNGSGRARIRVNDETSQVCYRVAFRRIGRAQAAHIHRGRKGSSGDVVVTLWDGSEGSPATGCVTVSSALAERIQDHPRRYYVNLHTREYPDGAIRGNLTKSA